MATNAEALEKLRERYRGHFPYERLILCIDRREKSQLVFAVVAVDRDSAWYDFLPPEQIVEIRDQAGRDEDRHQ